MGGLPVQSTRSSKYALDASDIESLPIQGPTRREILKLVITVIVCVLTVWVLYRVSDRSDEQRSETEAPKSVGLEVPPEKKTPFLKLQGEIKKASGEQDNATSPVEEEPTSAKDGGDAFEPFRRIARVMNPLTIPARLKRFFGQLMNFCKKPSWTHLSEKIGCDNLQKRPRRLSPSYKDCKDHGIVTTQRAMGTSCLFFFLPGVIYVWQLCVNGSSISPGHKIAAGIMSVFFCYVSTVSFLADYWYTGDDEMRENHKIPECRKQYIFNAIDLVNVPIIGMVGLGFMAVQYMYGNAYRWVMPFLFVSGCVGIAIQQLSLKYLKDYTEIAYAEDYDRTNIQSEAAATKNLEWGLNLHIVWHVFAVIPPIVQMYLLLKVGVSKPSWMSCF